MFKVGDKVRLKPESKCDLELGYTINAPMKEEDYFGSKKEFTIFESSYHDTYDEEGTVYTLEESNWCYPEQWLIRAIDVPTLPEDLFIL